MTYLLVKWRNSYELYSPDIFGLETWGSTSQLGIEKKRKNWYLTSWTAGNDWVDDSFYKTKLNVVIETKELSDIIKYIENNNKKQLREIIEAASKILADKSAFDSWVLKGAKQK